MTLFICCEGCGATLVTSRPTTSGTWNIHVPELEKFFADHQPHYHRVKEGDYITHHFRED